MNAGRIEASRCVAALFCCVASSCTRGAEDPPPPPSRYEVSAAAPRALGAHAASVERDVSKLLPTPPEGPSELPGDDAPEPPQPDEEPPDAGAPPVRTEPGVSL